VRRTRARRLILYLRQRQLLGARLRKEGLARILDCPLEEFRPHPHAKGPAVVILQTDALDHRVVSVPGGGKINFRRLMAREAVDLLGVEEVALGWRPLGVSEEEGVEREKVLLFACKREEILRINALLEDAGIEAVEILSALDLLVEFGKRAVGNLPSLLVVFDGDLIHCLFFKEGIFGFHRVFPALAEEVPHELTMELQRSIYYAKQRFKSPVSHLKVALAPPWFGEEMLGALREALQVPCTLIPSKGPGGYPGDLGLLGLLAEEPGLLEPLSPILAPEVMRRRQMRKLAFLSTSVELLLLGFVATAIFLLRDSLMADRELLDRYVQSFHALDGAIAAKQGDLKELERLKKASNLVREIVAQRPSLVPVMIDVAQALPTGAHLESMKWISPVDPKGPKAQKASQPPPVMGGAEPGRLEVEGKVDLKDPSARYELFSLFLEELRRHHDPKDVKAKTEELLDRGRFSLSLPVTVGAK
jgi:hypothetical protein